MEVFLEGKDIKSIKGFHDSLKLIFEFPDYYGENLDALWDCLSAWIELPITLIWKDYDISRKNLGEYAERAMDLFRTAEEEVDGFRIEQR